MKRVLVLGAGLVSEPLVRYLLEQPDIHVTQASRTVGKAEKIIGDHPRGAAKMLLVEEEALMEGLISDADVVISLLPYIHHVTVAKLCLKQRKHMVTTSYVSDAMKALDSEAKAAGVALLNELGLDPGIDHMSAMRIIDHVHAGNGKILSFKSYCGGLPAPEANDNPWGYKFSWSPRGVVLAGRNSATYLMDGQVVEIPGEELFNTHWPLKVEGLEEFDAYPNRNSLPYIDLYNITETRTMYRGTLRNKNWCRTWKKLVDLNFLDERNYEELEGKTFRELLAKLIGTGETANIKARVAEFLETAEDSPEIANMEWLGLFSDESFGATTAPLDILANRLNEKLQYKPGERDMVVLHHEFTAEYPGKGTKELITSTLIDFGIPNGQTSMSRTVGLPAAIATKMLVHEEIKVTGVHIPVIPEIYNPILDELERLGIKCGEKKQVIE